STPYYTYTLYLCLSVYMCGVLQTPQVSWSVDASPRVARADGRDVDAGEVQRSRVDLRAQGRTHPPAGVQGWPRRAAAVAQPAAAALAGALGRDCRPSRARPDS